MQKSIIRKGLVAGIIVLFLGIGVQPAFAVEITNVRPSDNIEDCDCQVTDNKNLVRLERLSNRIDSFIDRVETCTKLITKLSKDNPEVIEDFAELSEKITTFREIIDEELSNQISLYGSQSNEKICSILFKLFDISESILNILGNIVDIFGMYSIIYILLLPLFVPNAITYVILMILILYFDCVTYPL